MKRHSLKRLSHAERVELNQQLKDAVEVSLIPPSYSEFDSPIRFVRKLIARFDCAFTDVALIMLRVKMLTHFRVWTTHSMMRTSTPILL
jgi:hypothetical protein